MPLKSCQIDFIQKKNMKLKNVEKVVLSCCIIHNYLKSAISNKSSALPDDTVKDDDFLSIQRGFNRNSSQSAKYTRNTFLQYFGIIITF